VIDALVARTGQPATTLLGPGDDCAVVGTPDGRDAAWATAVLYVLIGPETWHLLRVELQYAPEEYRQWLRTALADSFHVGG